MLALRIEPEINDILTMLAKKQGRNKSMIVREAIIRYLEDLEDIGLAEEVLRTYDPRKTKSLQEVGRELGMDC